MAERKAMHVARHLNFMVFPFPNPNIFFRKRYNDLIWPHASAFANSNEERRNLPEKHGDEEAD